MGQIRSGEKKTRVLNTMMNSPNRAILQATERLEICALTSVSHSMEVLLQPGLVCSKANYTTLIWTNSIYKSAVSLNLYRQDNQEFSE